MLQSGRNKKKRERVIMSADIKPNEILMKNVKNKH
jgi:hypothetical protein